MHTSADARFWDRASRRYAASAIADPAGYERTLERTRALLKPGDRVLELGCGTGTTALRLAGEVSAYLATDISSGMIAIAEEKRTATRLPVPAFRVAGAEALTVADGPFDVILGFNYLHLVRDPAATLRHIGTLLAPGGLFISKTPCVGDMNPAIRLLVPVMRTLGTAPHVVPFGAAGLRRLITEAGFTLQTVESHATKGRDVRPFIVATRQ